MQPNPVTEHGVDDPPDHLHLPESDGKPMENFQERPRTDPLASSIAPTWRAAIPTGSSSSGQLGDLFPAYDAAAGRLPCPGLLHRDRRPDARRHPPPVLRAVEGVRPTLLVEYVSGDGSEERDETPHRGKFWVYEQAIAAPDSAILDRARETLEVYELIAGRYLVESLGVEPGLWKGRFRECREAAWLGFRDAATGKILPTEEETAARERQLRQVETERAENAEMVADDARRRLEDETERAEKERKRAEALAARLRLLDIDPDAA